MISSMSLFSSVAHAQGGGSYNSPAEQKYRASEEALKGPISFVWSFETGFWQNVSMKVLNLMVQEGITNLQTVGEIDLSQQMQKEWQGVYADTLTSLGDASSGEFGALDLGDHPPLFQWLTNYVDILNAKTRGIAGKIQLISDLTTMNYALPIVFSPRGAWTKDYGTTAWVEYRLHFIPFANVITYWGSYEGCKYESAKYPGLSNVCDPLAGKLQFYMGRYIAPVISDYVFKEANPGTVINDNGPTKPSHLSDYLPSASDLASSIQDNGGQQ